MEKNKETPAVAKTTKEKFVNFVRAGQKPKKEGVKKEGMLDLAADWLLYDDLGDIPGVYLCHHFETRHYYGLKQHQGNYTG